MAVIHSARLVQEPVVLARNGHPRPLPAAPVPQILAPQPPPQPSYEEYKQRFAGELETERREARERGWQEGREAGAANAAAEHASQIEALASLARAARKRLEDAFDDLSDIGAEIAFEAVCKILGQALTDRDSVVSVVRELARRARDRSRLVLRVSPADFELLSASRERILEGLEAGQVEIAADERVELGGCLLETPSGNLDARLEVQLSNLRHALLAARGGQAAGDAAK